ncbi:CYTH domain-containing protein [Waterburya agarophytonicola K14]|uniref:CYTH domain-containing protein n=1 Tax=Waterburya agarophytonicola KI4 TaxID=2874699 RepID=A0A964FG93_9CYAN|nr:CYTH domain-containing protein [Waterburya agarophytonicola]MCC0178630.1 CYTH domain-containing protein [Waterburya agarophytonicola KI4]
MGIEIERKYLVKKAEWRSHKEKLNQNVLALGIKYYQGYLPTSNETTVRIRIIGEHSYLTIKSKTTGHTRAEFEYPIPLEDGQQILENLCLRPIIEKVRYQVNYGGLIWEVDEFFGENQGLIIAEVELENETQNIDIPSWIEREVNDKKYFNSSLIKYPYNQWQDQG